MKDRDRTRTRAWPNRVHFATLLLGITAVWPIAAPAQIGNEEVHLSPRSVAGRESAADRSAAARRGSIVKDVDLVLVPVTVTDDAGRPVTGLAKENFDLFEGQSRQQVQYFSSDDAPISIGILFDTSRSMSDKIDGARNAIAAFLKSANPEDEFFAITFSNRPELISDFTSSPEEIQNELMLAAPKGATALHDAIYWGLSKARSSRHARKALLIVSDGGDNHSRYSEREVMDLAKEADTPIYAIGIHYAPRASEERFGSSMLGEMTAATGGLHFTIDRPEDLADVTTKIGYLLRNRYLLGYRPDNVLRDGKWRKIKVKLQAPSGSPRWMVSARTGYYAPAR